MYTHQNVSALFFSLNGYQACTNLREQVGDELYYDIVDNNFDDIMADARYNAVIKEHPLTSDPSSVRIGDADSIQLEQVPIAYHDLVEEIGNRIRGEICQHP